MARVCEGFVCVHIATPYTVGKSMYGNGAKYCNLCRKYMKVDKKFCPCCGTILRTGRKDKNA